jgi:hypothetical protein
MDAKNVLATRTVHFGTPVGTGQRPLADRCAEVWARTELFLLEHPHDAVVLEGFVTFTSPKRANAYIHQTPYLVGYLAKAMDEENLVFQTSTEVFRPIGRDPDKRESVAYYAPRGALGLDMLTNEHLRAAACHGWYYHHFNPREAM